MLHLPLNRRLIRGSLGLKAVTTGVLYFLLAELGHGLSFEGPGFATFWPPSGLLLAVLITSPRWQWPLLLLLSAVANIATDVLLHGQFVGISLAFWMANSIEATLGAVLTQTWLGGRNRLRNLQDMVRLFVIALVCPLAGAAIGATTVTSAFGVFPLVINFRLWWGADALGILVIAPLALSLLGRDGSAPIGTWKLRHYIEALVLSVTLALVANSVFSHALELNSYPLPVRFPGLVMPLLAWAGLRFHIRGAILGNSFVALVASYYGSRGVGPFAMATEPVYHLLALQAFCGFCTFLSLALGSGVTQSSRAEAQQRRLASALRTERSLLEQSALEREALIAQLQRAVSELKTLRGLIPICASCKSIRDDDGYWQRLEGYLIEHTEAEFTHCICNDCGVKLYGQLWQDAVIDAPSATKAT